MPHLPFLLFVCVGAVGAAVAKKLTVPAAVTGSALAALIYSGVGWAGIALMGMFFLLGTGATSWKKASKRKVGLAEEKKGRTTGQVLANGGAAGLLGLAAILFHQYAPLCLTLIAAAFSSATADTLASELGSVYGKRFYDILSFKKSVAGPDGVVSAEGFLFGAAGSAVTAAVYAMGTAWSTDCVWLVVAGSVGNLTDSYLGATLERRGLLGNNAVNFLNTAAAAGTMLLLGSL